MIAQVGLVVLGIYAVLLVVGGVIGFKKAGSKPSLIAGSISGAVAAVSAILAAMGNTHVGFGLALALAVSMLAFFGKRFAKSRKFMPAGLMVGASVVVVCVSIAVLVS